MEDQVLDNELAEIESSTEPKWAGFWIRVGASLVDFLVYLPLIGLNMYNLYVIKSLAIQLIISLLLLLYKPFMEYKYGATFGKMAVKIKVVNLHFENITLGQSILRFSPWILGQVFSVYSAILLFQHPDFLTTIGWQEVGLLQQKVTNPTLNFIGSGVLLISCVAIGLSKTKQGLHDMLAGTYCIYKQEE